MRKLISTLMLFVAACIWGAAFVAQSVGMEYIGPLTFNGVRYTIGGIVLLPVVAILSLSKRKAKKKAKLENKHCEDGTEISSLVTRNNVDVDEKQPDIKKSIVAGIWCGLFLLCASILQQYGILYSQAGKAGFITTLYIILVPILGVFLKKKIPAKVWFCAMLALVGLYLLCSGGTGETGVTGSSMSLGGEFLLAISALLFAFHIMVIDHYSDTDGVILSCVQFFVCGLLSMVAMFIFEKPVWADIRKAYIPILYAGTLSCGVAYTFQVIAQKYTEPTVASMVLSLESVMAALSAWLILGEELNVRELTGCAIVFVAIVAIQLPSKLKKQKGKQ